MTKQILFSDPVHELECGKQIEQQRDNIQKAVAAYNSLAKTLHLVPLQPDQLRYMIPGGATWCLHAWSQMQRVPQGWPHNVSREKFIEILEKPNFGQIDALCKRCDLIWDNLFVLTGEKVSVDDELAERYITQRRVYLEPGTEAEKYEKLQKLVDIAYELGLVRHDTMTRELVPLDLSQTGVRFIPFSEGRVAYQFDAVDRLKAFLAK